MELVDSTGSFHYAGGMAARPDFHEAPPDEALVVASDRFGVVMAVAFGSSGACRCFTGVNRGSDRWG